MLLCTGQSGFLVYVAGSAGVGWWRLWNGKFEGVFIGMSEVTWLSCGPAPETATDRFNSHRWRWSVLCWMGSRSQRWPSCRGKRSFWTNLRRRFIVVRRGATLRSHRWEIYKTVKPWQKHTFNRSSTHSGQRCTRGSVWTPILKLSAISLVQPELPLKWVQFHFLLKQTNYVSKRKYQTNGLHHKWDLQRSLKGISNQSIKMILCFCISIC